MTCSHVWASLQLGEAGSDDASTLGIACMPGLQLFHQRHPPPLTASTIQKTHTPVPPHAVDLTAVWRNH